MYDSNQIMEVLDLYEKGDSYQTIADKTGLTHNQVDHLIYRIRKKIKNKNDNSTINEKLVIYLYQRLLTYTEIAELLGVTYKRITTIVTRLIKKGVLKSRANKQKIKDTDLELLIRLYKENVKYSHLAKIFDCTEGCIESTLRRVREKDKSILAIKRRPVDIDIEKFVDLYNKNYTVEQLAEHFFYSIHKISHFIKQLKSQGIIKDRALSGAKQHFDETVFKRLYKQGLTYSQIGRSMGFSKCTVSRYATKMIQKGEIDSRLKKIDDKELIELYRKFDGSHLHLSMIYNCSKTLITKKLKQLHEKGNLPEYHTYLEQHRKKMGEKYRNLKNAEYLDREYKKNLKLKQDGQ